MIVRVNIGEMSFLHKLMYKVNAWQSLKKLNMQLPCDPAIALLAFYPEKWRFMFTQKPTHACNSNYL